MSGNRKARRAAAARARKRNLAFHNNLYKDYIQHLQQIPTSAPLEPGGVNYIAVFHDESCRFYESNDIDDCNCEPHIARYIEPRRRS